MNLPVKCASPWDPVLPSDESLPLRTPATRVSATKSDSPWSTQQWTARRPAHDGAQVAEEED
jgi:hypothetical protein